MKCKLSRQFKTEVISSIAVFLIIMLLLVITVGAVLPLLGFITSVIFDIPICLYKEFLVMGMVNLVWLCFVALVAMLIMGIYEFFKYKLYQDWFECE
jgi:hypothetical protein